MVSNLSSAKNSHEALKIAIIIPAYNEELTINAVIRVFYNELPNANIIVVDNRSTDNTNAVACSTLEQLHANGQVLFEPQKGKASAMRRAFRVIQADIYVMVDADMTYPASAVHALVRGVMDGYDMVVGNRMADKAYQLQNNRKFHILGNRAFCSLVNTLFNGKLLDIFSGYRAFSSEFVKNFPVMSSGFAIEAELSIHALDKRFSILELPIAYSMRTVEGSVSKLNTYRDGLVILRLIAKLVKDYYPIRFFGLFSTLLFCLSLAAGFPVIEEFLRTQIVAHVPLAILASAIMILSIMCLGVGLILDTVACNHRFTFEHFLLRATQKGNIDSAATRNPRRH